MDLLTQPQRDAIRAAIQSVTDTFSKTSVTFQKLGDSANEFMEELDFGTRTEFEVLAIIEYTAQIKDKVNPDPMLGLDDESEVRLTINYDDMDTAGLTDSGTFTCTLKPETDLFNMEGEDWKVVYVATDGKFEARPLLVYVWGIKRERK